MIAKFIRRKCRQSYFVRLAILSDNFLHRKKLDFPRRNRHAVRMKLIIQLHNVTLTQAIENYVLKRLDKLEHLDRWTIDARVTLERDHTRVPEKQFCCSMRLCVRGPDLFAEDRESDLYAAIDIVTKKIEQQIRKRHGKFKVSKHKDAAKVKALRRATVEE
jgi:putative sigma-54 modulation protein